MTTRRNFIAAAALMAAAAPLTSGLPLAEAKEDKEKVQLMFVQTADDLKADDKTLRLINVGKQTLYFSDRPKRIAGHLTMPAYCQPAVDRSGPHHAGPRTTEQ